MYSLNTERFIDDGSGAVKALAIHEVEFVDGAFKKIEGTDRELPADYVSCDGLRRPRKGVLA